MKDNSVLPLKHFFILTITFLLLNFNAVANLKDIYILRVKSNDFLKAKKIDSASFYLSKIINDAVYANATDYMNLSCCRLQLKDTAAFQQYLVYSIETGGADSTIIPLYFRSLDSNDNIYFKTFLNSVLPKYRAMFLKKTDPQIEQEMKDIAFLDQMCRKTDDKGYPRDTASLNFKHLRAVGRYIDSVNYVRVVDLIQRNKYPGFHNFGITSANYDPVLMHVSDLGDEQWDFIFNFLKQQLNSGDIMQNQVIAIVTRHFKRDNCTYYGTEKWGLTTPCDCKQVDKFRAAIGLDSLKEEYSRLNKQLPGCYHE